MGIRVQRTGARAAAGRWQKNEGIQTCAKGAAAVLSRQAKVAMTCVVRSVRARHVNASRAQCAPKARFSAAGRPALVAAARSLPMLLRNHEPARPPSALRVQAMQSRRLREEVGISCSQPVGWKHAARTPLISRCCAESLWPLRTVCPRSAGCAPPEAAACLIWPCRGLFLIVLEIAAARGQGCGGVYPQCLESACLLNAVMDRLNQRVRCSWTEPSPPAWRRISFE
jgi:hypothetical protein